VPGRIVLEDISKDGKILVDQWDPHGSVYVGTREKEHELTSTNDTHLTDMSSDGRTMVYVDDDPSEGPDFGAYLRTTDGSPSLRLGDGMAIALSPDGMWAAVRRNGPPLTLSLVPTGPGESRPLSLGKLGTIIDGRFFPDGHRLLLRGFEGPGHLLRLWVHDLGSGDPEPITAEGVAPISVILPTGDRFAGVDAQGALRLFGIHGEELRQIPGDFGNYIAVRANQDGSALYLRTRALPVEVVQVALASGVVSPLITLPTSGMRPGLEAIWTVCLSADGRSYAYSTSETLSHLYIVDGLVGARTAVQ